MFEVVEKGVKGIGLFLLTGYLIVPLFPFIGMVIAKIFWIKSESCQGTPYVKGCGKRITEVTWKSAFAMPLILWSIPFVWITKGTKEASKRMDQLDKGSLDYHEVYDGHHHETLSCCHACYEKHQKVEIAEKERMDHMRGKQAFASAKAEHLRNIWYTMLSMNEQEDMDQTMKKLHQMEKEIFQIKQAYYQTHSKQNSL